MLVRNAQHSSLANIPMANNAHVEPAMLVAALALSDMGNKEGDAESNVLLVLPGHGTWWVL